MILGQFHGVAQTHKKGSRLTHGKLIFLTRWWVGRSTLRERSALQIPGFLSRQLIPTALRGVRSIFFPESNIKVPSNFNTFDMHMDIYAHGFYILATYGCTGVQPEEGKTGPCTNTWNFLPAPKIQVSAWETTWEAVYGTRAQEVGILYPLLQFPMLGWLFHLKM